MPANAFDDALTRLPKSANPFDDIADEIVGGRTSAVSAAVERGARENPDQQADLIRMADRLRMPLDVLKRNPDAYKGVDTLQQTDLDRLIQRSPRLAQHLTDSPEFASVAHDDLPALGAMERALGITTDVGISLLKGAIGIPQSVVGFADLVTGGHTGKVLEDTVGFRPAEASAILSTYYSDPQRAAFLRVQQASGLVGKATAALSNPSVVGQTVLESAPLMLGGAGLARGLIGLAPSLISGVAAGAIGEGLIGAGMAAEQTRTATPSEFGRRPDGTAKGNGFLGVLQRPDGGVMTEYSIADSEQLKDEKGNYLDYPTLVPTLTKEEVQTVLNLNEGEPVPQPIKDKAEAFALERRKAGKPLFAQDGEQQAGLHPEIPRVSTDRLLTLKQAALSAASGVGTAAFGMLGGKVAKALGISDVETMLAGAAATPTASRGLARTLIYGAVSEGLLEELPQSVQEQILQNAAQDRPLDEGVAENAVLGALAGAIMGGGANLTEHYAAVRGEAAGKTITDLGTAASASKTAKRSPEAVESFVAQAVKDSPNKAVYAPVDTWTTYWQSKGEDPAAMATSLTGDPQAYQKAVALGTDLEIPIAKYAAKLAPTEHNAFFANELKLDPADMNAREAAAHVEQLRQQQAAAQPTEPTQPSTLDQATDLMTQRMTEQGIPADTAQTYGAIWRAGIGTLASNFGIDPLALQAQYGPQGGPTITREGMEPGPTTAPVPGEAAPEDTPEGAPVEVPTPEPQAPDTILAPDLSALTADALAQRVAEHPQAVAAEFLRRAGVAEQDRRATERSAETDPLTGLGNGRALSKALPAAEADPNTSVLFFDANNFGKVNKTAGGHEAGDATLKEVATALQQAAAEVGYGARVFRPHEGGDEFVALIPRDVATQVRERAETLFGDRQFVDKEGQPFTVSLTGTEGATAKEAESQLQAAKEARKRAPQWAPTAAVFVDTSTSIADTEALDGTLPTPAGDQIDQGAELRDRTGERVALATGGLAVPEGAGVRGERGGLPTSDLRGLPDVDEVFRRESGDVTAARFTPDVTRELARIADELDTFPFEKNIWVWDDPLANYDPNFGTAAGGKANIISGNAGAPVYHDILAFSPVNTSKGQAARKVRGSRADVLQAIRAALEAQDIPTNLAEGAMRVAEHRAAGDYYYLSQPQLPHRPAPFYPNEEAASVLEEADAIEPEGDVDTSFDPTTFKQEQRGEIRFGANRQFNIHLLEHADLSTVLHEFSHFFLEVFGDLSDKLAQRDPATLTPEQQRLQADYQATLASMDVTSRSEIGTEQHEQWARRFEAYLMEGKAPSLELRSAFARARAWMLQIYKTLRGLNVTLTPEVRGIFDRLLASDAAIQQAQQTASVSGMFLTAESAGMTDAQFASYRGDIEDASRKAKEDLDRQILAEVQREQTATWKAQREAIKQQVTTEVQQQPVYRALAAMQKGTHPNGDALIEGEETDPLKLSKTIISERYGVERLKALPKPYIYSREGGLDPDTVAEMFGFSSGDALLTAVSTAPSMRSVIERETAGRMFQQHGSLLLDGTLGEKAQAAVANDSREEVIRKELKALHTLQRKGAATLKATVPPMTAIRQAAAQQIARAGIENIKPQLYWSAGLRAGRQAVELAAQQKFPEAVQAKLQQLFNLSLYREAVKQRDEMETRKDWVNDQNKAAGRQRLAEAGGSYLDQWDGYMDRYEFRRVPQNVLDRRARLDKWIASQKAEGLAIDLPDALLDDSRRINYRQMTVEEFTGLTDGLKQLVHFAKLKKKLLGRQAARELDDIGNTVADRLYSTAKAGTTGPRLTRHKSMLDKVAKYGRDLGASFFNADTILRELDGWEDVGPVYEHLKGGIDRAVVEDFIPRTNATAEALSTINSVYKRGEVQKRVEIKALNDSLTREEIIAFALNWGTTDNRAALLESKKWAAIGANEQTAHAILDTLDQRDWDYIQSVWDHVETYWSDIEASQKRRKGFAPPKVEAAPIETKYGSYRGGYYPLKYDSEGDILTRQDAIEDTLERMRTGRYAAAATKAGFAQERIGSGGRPVLLSLSVIAQHVGEVNYDLALGDEIRAVDRILRHKTVREAFEATGRQGMHEALDLWLHDVATGEIAAADAVSRGSRWIRSGLTVSALALNMGTAAMNVGAPAQSAVVIGKRAMLRGMTDLVTHKWIGEGNIFQQITEASPFMAERQTSFNKDITTAMQTIRDSRIPSWVGKFYFYFITKSQWLADSATWLGAHQKGLIQFESDSEKAAAYADRMVARSQASGLWADRTAIERGTLSQTTRQSEFVKLWSTLMSYMLAKANVAYEKTASRNFRDPAQVAGWTVDMALLFGVEALFAGLLHGQFDDDDDWGTFFGHWLLETGKNMVTMLPFVREVESYLEGYPTGGPIGAAAKRLGDAGKQVAQGEFDLALVKAMNSAGGMLFHYPSSALNRIFTAGTKAAEGEDVPLLDYLIYREDRGESRR